jgi:hypothetical protein
MIQSPKQLTFCLDESTGDFRGRPAAILAEDVLRIEMDRLLRLDAFRWLANFGGENDASL